MLPGVFNGRGGNAFEIVPGLPTEGRPGRRGIGDNVQRVGVVSLAGFGFDLHAGHGFDNADNAAQVGRGLLAAADVERDIAVELPGREPSSRGNERRGGVLNVQEIAHDFGPAAIVDANGRAVEGGRREGRKQTPGPIVAEGRAFALRSHAAGHVEQSQGNATVEQIVRNRGVENFLGRNLCRGIGRAGGHRGCLIGHAAGIAVNAAR